MNTNDSLLYLASLPERLVRAIAAGAGGLLYESSLVLLPGWTRDMQVYQTFVGRMLRITVEWAGGVQGVIPQSDPVSAGRLAVRKVAGNAIELTSFLAVGWSPLWLLAAAADITGGTQVYLRAVGDELKRLGVLPPDQEFTTVDGLLDALQGTTGVLSRAIDIPPLAREELQFSAQEMREAWQALRDHAPGLPSNEILQAIADQMQQTAEREHTSVWAVSSLIGLGAVQAGLKLGQLHIFDYYRIAFGAIQRHGFGAIQRHGFAAYANEVSRPYLLMVVTHLDPQQASYTERALRQVFAPTPQPALPLRSPSP